MDAGVKEDIRSRVLDAGACACGFAVAEPVEQFELDSYDAWIAVGGNAGMEYMARYRELRADPRLLLEGTPGGARTLISCAFSYAQRSRHGLFADYALGADYHLVLRERLDAVASYVRSRYGGDTRVCVDTAPVFERYWAEKAGVGRRGLNGQLFVPGAVGSHVFLAEILWSGAVEPDKPLEQPLCTACGACVRACPGAALDGRGGVDASRCLSYMTIEHRGALPEDVSLAGHKIYGCDICQDVCPLNREAVAAADSVVPELRPSPGLMALDSLEKVVALTPEMFSAIFRRSAVKRAKLIGLLRNAARALGRE